MSHPNSTTSTTIFDGNNHRVATVRDGVLYRTIHTQHILKNPPAIAFDLICLAQAQKAGAIRLEVKNADTGEVYRATWQHFQAAALDIEFKPFGKQKALPLSGWTRQGPGPRQLSLFEGVQR